MLWITKLPKSPRPAPAPSATSFSLGLQDAGQFGVATGRRGFNRTSFNKSTSAPFVAVFISCGSGAVRTSLNGRLRLCSIAYFTYGCSSISLWSTFPAPLSNLIPQCKQNSIKSAGTPPYSIKFYNFLDD